MIRFTFCLLPSILLLSAAICSAQTRQDSATYWVNTQYIDCLEAGKSVCQCQEQNVFLMLHLDNKANKLTIEPSIYLSWEPYMFNIQPNQKHNWIASPGYGLDSGAVLTGTEKQLTLKTPQKTFVFNKIVVAKTDNGVGTDMGNQIAVINCKPLLNYAVKPCSGDSLLLSQQDLSNYILNKQIGISCSTDYYYNEMYIRTLDLHFFMVYKPDGIKIYKEPARDLDEAVEIDNLKECQLYYKKE